MQFSTDYSYSSKNKFMNVLLDSYTSGFAAPITTTIRGILSRYWESGREAAGTNLVCRGCESNKDPTLLTKPRYKESLEAEWDEIRNRKFVIIGANSSYPYVAYLPVE